MFRLSFISVLLYRTWFYGVALKWPTDWFSRPICRFPTHRGGLPSVSLADRTPGGSYKELSQYIIYTHGRFQIKAIDTYNFSPGATYNNKEFFNYKPDETGRFIDLMLNYTGDRKISAGVEPLYTCLRSRQGSGQQQEHILQFRICGLYHLIYQNEKLRVGPGIGTAFALRNSRNESGEMVNRTMYAESAGITQVSLNVIYKLRVMKYEIPLTVMTYWNPKSNQGFFYTGMQFNLFWFL